MLKTTQDKNSFHAEIIYMLMSEIFKSNLKSVFKKAVKDTVIKTLGVSSFRGVTGAKTLLCRNKSTRHKDKNSQFVAKII